MRQVAIPLGELISRRARRRKSRALPRRAAMMPPPEAPKVKPELTAAVAAGWEMRAVQIPKRNEMLTRIETAIREVREAIAKSEREFNDAMRSLARAQNLDAIILAVCIHFRVQPEELFGRSRPDRIAWPRQVAMVLMREDGLTLSQVGRRMGGRDHGTVIHAIEAVERRTSTDPQARMAVEQVRAELAAIRDP
mgnify:CR=1 FL=1